MLTVPETAKPLVHFMRMPELIDVCFTAKEKVNPTSLVLPRADSNFPPSFSANFASLDAIKSKSS